GLVHAHGSRMVLSAAPVGNQSMRSRCKRLRVGWAGRVGVGVRVLLALAATLGGGACSSSPETSSVEILHWWKQGGEAQAIEALLADFQRQYPGVKVIDSSVDGSSLARAAIRNRMSRMTPPDTFQANGGWDLMAWVLFNNTNADMSKMQELDPDALDL